MGNKRNESGEGEEKTGIEKVIDEKIQEMTEALTNTLQGIGDQIKEECKNYIKSEVEKAEGRLMSKIDNKDSEKDKKIKELDDRMERMEKNERRNNVILWGAKAEVEDMEQVARDTIVVKMGVEVGIEKVWLIKDKAIGVKVKNYEEKMKIFEKRKLLKGTDIVLGDDLTEKERELQKILKIEAEKARKNDPNKVVRIGYGKLKIGDKWFRYDEEKKKLFG